MPPITSALQFPISNHASGTHSSPLLGDRHAPGGTTSPPAPQGQPLQANNATRDAHACLFSSSADLLVRPPLEDDRDAPLCAPSNLSQLGSHKFRSNRTSNSIPRSHHFTAKDLTKLNGTYLREEIWEFSITSS